jgi:putative endonuclease
MKEHNYYIYILTTANHKLFYTGVTNDLVRRDYEHKNKLIDGFTKEYNVTKLVYFEHHTDIEHAIRREKLIKKWKQEFKVNAITKMNPQWKELSDELRGADPATSAG